MWRPEPGSNTCHIFDCVYIYHIYIIHMYIYIIYVYTSSTCTTRTLRFKNHAAYYMYNKDRTPRLLGRSVRTYYTYPLGHESWPSASDWLQTSGTPTPTHLTLDTLALLAEEIRKDLCIPGTIIYLCITAVVCMRYVRVSPSWLWVVSDGLTMISFFFFFPPSAYLVRAYALRITHAVRVGPSAVVCQYANKEQ